jgi:hypothetical protein
MDRRVTDHELMKIQDELKLNFSYLKSLGDESGIPRPFQEMAKIMAKMARSQVEIIDRILEGNDRRI